MQDKNGINNGKVGSWDEWGLYIARTLRRVELLSEKNHDEMLILKTKVAVIGGLTGIAGAGLTTLIINLIIR